MRYESVEQWESCAAEEQETMVCSHKGKEPEEKTASLTWRTPDKKTNSEKKDVVRILRFNRSAWSTASGCMMEKK